MFGAEPIPASLENRPRFTPLSIAAATEPATPPAAGAKPKALAMISENIDGTSPILIATANSAMPR